MIVNDLDGNKHKWKITGKQIGTDTKNRSQPHLLARELLVEMYPTILIYEEVPIYVAPRKKLYLDFYVPMLQMAIEVHGRQHYEFVEFFHKNRFGWMISRKNDRLKLEWCALNGITTIELPYNESKEQWQKKIML